MPAKMIQKTLLAFFIALATLTYSGNIPLNTPLSNQVAHASIIGSHLGEGDAGAQVDNMDILGSKTNGSPFPVTIQTRLGDTSPAALELLHAATIRNNMIPIVRVDHVCEPAKASQASSFINQIRAVFGQDVIIAWGNEVNNEDAECPSPTTFSQTFNAVRGNVAPSAIDFYNGKFSGIDFLARFSTLYSSVPKYASNAYGCFNENECNIATTQTHLLGFEPYKIGGKPWYLTEFSLSPGDGSPNNGAPDTVLSDVVEFIETRGPQTGATYITPLIRNVCNNDGDWLLYVSATVSKSGQSEVYTRTGMKVDIETCDESTVDKDDYYLYPIPGFIQDFPDYDTKIGTIIEDLLAQGYQAQCLAPQITLDAVIPGLPNYLYDQIGSDEILRTETELEISFADSSIPLLRRDGNYTIDTINSLETLFGFKGFNEEEALYDADTDFGSAPIYRSLTQIDQCVQQTKILDTIRAMCDKLENPNTCALNEQIRRTNFKMFDLQAIMSARISSYLGGGTEVDAARVRMCTDLIQKTDINDQIRLALRNTPLFIPNAYRLGFLVMTLELKGDNEGVTNLNPFRFMRPNTGNSHTKPPHLVRVFAFKIPDVATNKDINSDIYYQDPIQQTSRLGFTLEEQKKQQRNYETIIHTRNEYSDYSLLPVRCIGNDQNPSAYCRNENTAARALTIFVNDYLRPPNLVKYPRMDPSVFNIDGSINESRYKEALFDPDLSSCSLDASQLPAQEITRIFGSAGLPKPETEDGGGRVFEGNKDIYDELQKDSVSQSFPIEAQSDSVSVSNPWPFSFLSEAKIKSGSGGAATLGEGTVIRSYVIIPQGFELGIAESHLLGRITTLEDQDKMFAEIERGYISSDNRRTGLYVAIDNITTNIQNTALLFRDNIVDYLDPPNCIAPGSNVPTPNESQSGDDATDFANLANTPNSELGSLVNPTQNNQPTSSTTGPRFCRVYDLEIKVNSRNMHTSAPRVHGGLFGELILRLQKSNYTQRSRFWENLQACRNIEDFILQTCDREIEVNRPEIQPVTPTDLRSNDGISPLTPDQQEIVTARSGTMRTVIGEVPPADDPFASASFKNEVDPGSFAVFSIGAYTHRNGMSQYGAKARADQGQSVEEILRAYYPNATLRKDYPVPSSITVDGHGVIPFEDQYLHGIYEMPSSWNINALKAQAIAARTYAIRRTNGGQSSICTTEACQVFRNQRKGGNWEQAVQETRGWVLVDSNGNPISTQYASTHGGYANTSGWDTTDKSGDGEWTTRAWEVITRAPWFYKAWYRSGYSSSGPNCGRAHPWLNQEEFADIVNAWIVRKNPNGADTSRILPVTLNECQVAGKTGNPYSIHDLRNAANNSGGAVTSIQEVTTDYTNQAQTATVHIQTNRGVISIPGEEFKTTFNLRAPGYIAIPQRGFSFFNIEYKL